MIIAITGATGFIGSALVEHLRQEHHLILVGRDKAKLSQTYPGMSCHDYAELSQAFTDADAVVHLAAATPGSLGADAGYIEANHRITMKVVEAIRHCGVPLLIFSSTILKTQRGGYAISKRRSEEFINKFNDFQHVILKLSAVHGEYLVGRLAIINKFPSFFRPMLLCVLTSLRPTASMSTVLHHIDEALNDTDRTDRIVSDRQMNNSFYKKTKRFYDLASSTLIVLFLSWLLLIIYLIIPLETRGPSIFKQTRVGENGRKFTCYKFRTMKMGTPEAGSHEVSQSTVTRIGKFLRRYKIDELPQVVNIFRGEMSLVGPRPCLPSQSELISQREKFGVYEVLPGITGLAQINGIDMSDPVKLALWDRRAIAERSLLSDISIILATISGRGHGDKTSPMP